MTKHEIKKPTLFISHATSDAEFAIAVQQEIEKVFANGINVFCTSSPGAITGGADWLSETEENLDRAQAVVAIVTPVSIERPWLWFELGATWSKGRSGECRIYPLCAKEIDLSNLPSPLDRLQARSMGRAIDLRLLFEDLISQFDFGKISSFRATNISRRIPRYTDVKVVETDLNERILYSGKYTGYSDDELMEVIDAELLLPDKAQYEFIGRDNILDREGSIHDGELVHFREIDRRLDLPPGTAKRLLSKVAERYDLKPKMERDHIVRYKHNPRKGR